MTIQILPPQLANQIAAGEVVERPASVVKELVENALDAGATKIEIDIERGGHKKILISDNGKGIPKDQLALALSRHATSKIKDIDDLEAIVSLGFRGEALASISSVARLTMTSKPKDQNEAWSAMAEGLDMQVEVKPAAHPNGTTVEVLDLFFNTPARRKFLRAEKTEFSHIESLIRRIAMSRPDASFVLKHNNKVVKRYRTQLSDKSQIAQQSGRIAEVINAQFIEQSSVRTGQYDDIKLTVWAKSPVQCKSVNPAQFSFVNGRMMRDKLIQHAIRQAYADALHSEQQPEYVLFIELPAKDVDVNVHPAKHEVRFHHARLLHDLIVGTIQECLADFVIGGYSVPDTQQSLSTVNEPKSKVLHSQSSQAPDWLVMPSSMTNNYDTSVNNEVAVSASFEPVARGATPKRSYQTELRDSQSKSNNPFPGLKPVVKDEVFATDNVNQTSALLSPQVYGDFTVFALQSSHALVEYQNQQWIVDLKQLFKDNSDKSNATQIKANSKNLTPAPLLVPVRIKLTEVEKQAYENCSEILQECGFDTKLHQHFLIIKQVPSVIRSKNCGRFLPQVFGELLQQTQVSVQTIIELLVEAPTNAFDVKQISEQLHIISKQPGFDKAWLSMAVAIDLAHIYQLSQHS